MRGVNLQDSHALITQAIKDSPGQRLKQILDIKNSGNLLGHLVDEFEASGLILPFLEELGVFNRNSDLVSQGKKITGIRINILIRFIII